MVDSAVCEFYDSSTFEQRLGFPDVELVDRLQVKQSGPQDCPSHRDALDSDARNMSIKLLEISQSI